MNFKGFGTLVIEVVEARIWLLRLSSAGKYSFSSFSYKHVQFLLKGLPAQLLLPSFNPSAFDNSVKTAHFTNALAVSWC
jgi:hypothetical protein